MKELKDKIYYYMEENNLKLEELIKNYNHYIYTIINNFNFNLLKEDKEEILLDVYITLWNNKEKLDINKSMTSYIAGITKKLTLKKYRGNKIIENIDDYAEYLKNTENIELDYITVQENQIIIDELNKVKKIDKDIFTLYYYDELKIKEISLLYNISESKVKSKLFRIRKKIKKILKEKRDDLNE